MNKGAIRNFIRVRPIDPRSPYVAAVDIDHIVGYKTYNWDNAGTTATTEILLSNGQSFVTNETPQEFEQRLLKATHNITFES